MDSAINAANEKLELISMDEDFQRYYYLRQLALTDYNSEMEYAREEGLAEGMEQGLTEGMEKGRAEGMEKGRHEGMEKAARNLKALGISMEIIVKSTGLSPEEIAKL